jgi:hypothetical protein
MEMDEFPDLDIFPGMEWQAAPATVYVAPALRSSDHGQILSYLSAEIEIVRIGLAENWRRGLRVMLRRQARLAV